MQIVWKPYGLEKFFLILGIHKWFVVVHCDKKATHALLHNTDMQPSRIKHIDNKHHQRREEIERGRAAYEYCPSAETLSDCLIKALPRAALEHQRLAMGLGLVL